jgi:type IV secretion system protein VirD4
MLHADDLAYGIAVILDLHSQHAELPAFVRNGMVNYLGHEGERVRTSVRSEAVSLIRVFSSARVQDVTSRTTMPLEELEDGERGVTLFIVVPPDRLESHAPLVRVLLGTLLCVMARRRRRPRVSTLFLVDELGHIGPIPQLKQAVTLLRGYGVRVALFLQSIAQLKSLWPHDYDTILENCGLWMNFGNSTHASARQISEQLGDIGADALFGMSGCELAIHRAGFATTVAHRLDYLNDKCFEGLFDPNPYYAVASREAP